MPADLQAEDLSSERRAAAGAADGDGDGLADTVERQLGTDPAKAAKITRAILIDTSLLGSKCNKVFFAAFASLRFCGGLLFAAPRLLE